MANLSTLASGDSITLSVTEQQVIVLNSALTAKARLQITTGSGAGKVVADNHHGRRVYGPFGVGSITLTAISGDVRYELSGDSTSNLDDDTQPLTGDELAATRALLAGGGGGTGTVTAASGALTANALVLGNGTTDIKTTTTGTGIVSALGANVGSAGAPVVNGGALGTPSSGTLTNATGLPAAGVTGTAVTLTALNQALNAGTTASNSLSIIGGTGASSAGGSYLILDGYQETWVTLKSNQAIAGNKIMRFGYNNNRTFQIQRLNDAGSSISNTPLTILSDAPDNSIYVLGSGNIGLGNSSPGQKLDVTGAIKLSGLLYLGPFTTGGAPSWIAGTSYYDTTLNKLRIGGASAWETVTSV